MRNKNTEILPAERYRITVEGALNGVEQAILTGLKRYYQGVKDTGELGFRNAHVEFKFRQ